MPRRLSNVIGFDDAPFPAGHEGPVKVVGAVYARLQLNGVLIGEVDHLIAGALTTGHSSGRV